MNMRMLYPVAVLVCSVLTGAGSAINNPAGLPTVPPSSVRSGLVRSPNPIDTRGNLVITGNVRGGKNFRGIVPYRSGTDFWGNVGSSSLDSFLRRSAGSEDFGRYTGRILPYYSRSQTVTTTRAGGRGVFRPGTAGQSARISDRVGSFALREGQSLFQQDLLLQTRWESYKSFGLTAAPPQETAESFSAEVGKYTQRRKSSAELRELETKELLKGLLQDEVSIKDVGRSPDLPEKSEDGSEGKQFGSALKQPSSKTQQGDTILPRRMIQEREFDNTAGESESDIGLLLPGSTGQGDNTTSLSVGKYLRGKVETEQKSSGEQGIFKWLPEAKRPEDKTLKYTQKKRQYGSLQGVDGRYAASDRTATDEIPEGQYEQRAKVIFGSHENFDSFCEAKFTRHITLAERYLKQGSYYQASDSYALASVYKPDNPEIYAGKSHALLAAGEYMSSALFLSRAFEKLSEDENKPKAQKAGNRSAVARVASSLMLIGRDKLESRVVDIEKWERESDSGELQFLLAYLYYQLGRVERAKEAITQAYEKMPEEPGVRVLKEAIEAGEQK